MNPEPSITVTERAMRIFVELMGGIGLAATLLSIVAVIRNIPRPTSAHDPDGDITYMLDGVPYVLPALVIYGAVCIWIEATANRRRAPSAQPHHRAHR